MLERFYLEENTNIVKFNNRIVQIAFAIVFYVVPTVLSFYFQNQIELE